MAWEALGAVIGAGFASGRELAVFFARFGRWSPVAIFTAVLAVWLLTQRILRSGEAPYRRLSWRIAFVALAVVSGGAMAAAAGEIAALTLPLHGAKYAGILLAMAVGHMCAAQNTPLLRRVCQLTTAAMVLMLMLCLRLPMQRAAFVPTGNALAASVHGVSWAGFNLALAAPMLSRRGESRSAMEKERAAALLTFALAALLTLGCTVLRRHPMAMHSELPLVQLTANLGRWGFPLCCTTLLLAEFSTLAASLRTLAELLPARWRYAGMTAVLLTALAGFGPVVGRVYPLLGGVCTVLLLLPKEFTLHKA